jgi:hypothetical protein
MSTTPVQPKADPAASAMIEAMVGQLEAALQMVKAPDYVNESAGKFIEALRKWAGGVN